jgi:hypothetical protein
MPLWKPPKDIAKAFEEGDGVWEDDRWSPIQLTAMSGTEYERRDIPIAWEIAFEPSEEGFEAANARLEAAFLACLFWVALRGPERIRSLTQFRIAYLLFATTLIAPSLINIYILVDNPNRIGRNVAGRPELVSEEGLYLHLVTPILLMLSFLMAIDSITPWRRTKEIAPRPAHGGNEA